MSYTYRVGGIADCSRCGAKLASLDLNVSLHYLVIAMQACTRRLYYKKVSCTSVNEQNITHLINRYIWHLS